LSLLMGAVLNTAWPRASGKQEAWREGTDGSAAVGAS